MKLDNRRILAGVFVGLVCLLTQTKVAAQRQPVITAPPLIGDSVKAGKTLTVQDTIFFNPALSPSIAQTNSLDNIVALYLNEFTGNVYPDTFHVLVRIQVNYLTATNTTGSRLDTLRINYSKRYPYNSKALKFYQNYYSLQTEVLEVAITGAPAESVRPLLQMESMMVIDRSYKTDCVAITSVSSSDSSLLTAGELSVSWPAVRFISSYDLEWTFIDKAALDSGLYNTGGQLDRELIFKNNATRLSLSANSYRIPLLYDGQGSVFFRVRTLQLAPDGEVIAGAWSSDVGTGGLGRYDFTGHQRNLNWQATTTYAEEGKRKSVVQYFDGSLKGRQTVTKDNSTKTTVVAETLYDKQGRPALQVLPTPTLSSLIAYTPLLNVRGLNSAEYDKSVYDTLLSPDDYCAVGADSMGVASGAAQYYSPANPLLANAQPGFHQYIPDAKGYPFTETRYTRDNTGRIDRQGGVGPAFQIGTGRETKYYYSTPVQKDLDALFGTEAGEASHYQKNMVRDANGQYSVSYVDMRGRTVATALAGDNPPSLERLGSYNSVLQTDNLLTPSNNIIKDNTIQATSSILVPKNGSYEFHYALSPESLSLTDCKDTTVCYDCLYDLTITISDNCNNEPFGGRPKVITLSNFSLFKQDGLTYNLDTTCTAAPAFDTTFTAYLLEGSYEVTKVLSVSKSGLQYYRDSVFLAQNTCKSYDQLVLEQLDSLRQRLDCTPDSAVTNLAVAYREQMMADLSPLSGQYADNAPVRSCFSIFDQDISGRYKYQIVEGIYRDEEGNRDLVSHFNGTDWVLVTPQNLTPEEFTNNFKESWAETLLPLHPEYRLLVEYEKLKSAYNWESDFSSTETYAKAVAKGFLNPTGSASLPASRFTVSGKTDSLFLALQVWDPSMVASAKQSIENALFNYLQKGSQPQQYSLWGVATGIVKCNNNDENCFDFWNQSGNVFNTDSLCTADLDMAWRLFRSQYLRIREDWIDSYTRQISGIYPWQITSPCTAVFPDRNIANAPVEQGYGGYNGTIQDTTTAYNNLNAYLYDNCKAYATRWWQELAPCGYTQADSAAIISRLIQVCYEGADSKHPFGSSTVKPSSTHSDRSFEEVIQEYNAVHYPGKDPVSCNAYLISSPKPYGQSAMIVNLPIIAAPDSCTCSKITELYTKFTTDSLFYGSFSNYMWRVHQTKVSQGTLDTLRNLCGGSSEDCHYLEKPILLPPVLQCNTGSVCVDCNQVRAVYDSFTVKFPGITPTQAEPDSTQRQINQLFANYMNHRTGFSKEAYEYLQFLTTCPPPISGPCDSTYWTVYNPGANLQINADLYANANNNLPPVDQFFSGGYFTGPSAAQSGHYVLVNKRDSIAAGTATLLMEWRVKPTSLTDMINPFIRRGSSVTYVGAEWIKDPADTTWWIGATILRGADGGMLSGLGLQSNSYGLKADWVKITDPSTGSVLYFEDFYSFSDCTGAYGPFLCGKPAQDSSMVLNMNPCADTTFMAVQGATYLHDIYRQKQRGEFDKQYAQKCLDAGKLERFTVSRSLTEYHYTLYYYDQAGSLVKTVPPEGVQLVRRESWLDSVEVARGQAEVLTPAHTLATTYRYNSLGQVVSQHSPDGGLSRFWYDRLGRLVVSQNAKQAAENNYSYTLYDALGRIREVGQKRQTTAMSDVIARKPQDLDNWLNYTYSLGGTTIIADQVISTVYDQRNPASAVLPSTGYVVNPAFQKGYTLRNRVSYTRYYDKLAWNGVEPLYSDYTSSQTFSYDIHGNVDTLLHHYRTGLMAQHGYNQFKAVAYRYDLISGKVNQVHFQPGMMDQLYHRYEYDAENRLTDAYSTDRKPLLGIPVLEEHEARYAYYKHGPLAKALIGQQQVQGLDYAYTLQGWLKGVNLDSTLEEGATARDALGFSLHYFGGDYRAVGQNTPTLVNASGNVEFKPLYNGNIGAMAVNIKKLSKPLVYNYGYDQLNRLVLMDAFGGWNPQGNTFAPEKLPDYKERVSYDGNGNILSYVRRGESVSSGLLMDSLTYQYERTAAGRLASNRLRYVHDGVQGNAFTGDLKTQTSLPSKEAVLADNNTSQAGDNYQYDAIGNLIQDTKEGITAISWTVYGKIQTIEKSDGTSISYSYDAAGNRISKTVAKPGVGTTTTWYVRDAQGNTLAVYSASSAGSLTLSEQHLYGSSRLGVWNRKVDMDASPSESATQFERGQKAYELTNHLGNVLAVVSDKKVGVSSSGATIDYYQADVMSAQDYYPFGMMMPGRQWNAGGYRYGFNGKENDNEVKGEGNQIDYGMRVHDPRLGRFLSVDPYTKDYPWNTPYAYAENEPISNIDLDGLEKVKSTMSAAAAGATQYAEEKKGQANGLLKLVTSTEPYRNLWGYAKDWGKAVTGDRSAIQNVNRKTTEVITQTSMSVANGISQPTTFLSTMHTRSPNENVQGLTFYGLTGLEFYALARIGESLNTRSSTLEAFEGNKIIRKALRDEVKILIAENAEDLAYLQKRGAKAAYFGGEGSSGTILITKEATRSHILEEAFHHQQRMTYGDDFFYSNRDMLELEAQNKMIEIGKREGWSKGEMDALYKAKATWEKEVKKSK